MGPRFQAPNDPWTRLEAWRYKGPFSTRARFGASLPGLGLGVGAFVAYCIVEKVMESGEAHH